MKQLSQLQKIGITEIPSNCLFNKIVCGCGGTSLEIENMNRDSIICVPRKPMIRNKTGQYPNERTPDDFILFGVMEGIYKDDVKEYLKNNNVHKIITTYDSLHKVIDAITELGERELKNYFLLIDEVHALMNDYRLRKDAIKPLLKDYKLFDNWC